MHTTNILGITQASNSQLNAMVRTAARLGAASDHGGQDTVCTVCSALAG